MVILCCAVLAYSWHQFYREGQKSVFENIARLHDSAMANMPDPYLPDSLYKIQRNKCDSFIKVSSFLIELRENINP